MRLYQGDAKVINTFIIFTVSDVHTAHELWRQAHLIQYCFKSTETMKTIRDGHLDFHTAPELCVAWVSSLCIYFEQDPTLIQASRFGFGLTVRW